MMTVITMKYCPNCGGEMLGRECARCLIQESINRAIKRKLRDGPGPTQKDPTPMQIKFRTFRIRQRRLERLRESNNNRNWKYRSRPVRIYPDGDI